MLRILLSHLWCAASRRWVSVQRRREGLLSPQDLPQWHSANAVKYLSEIYKTNVDRSVPSVLYFFSDLTQCEDLLTAWVTLTKNLLVLAGERYLLHWGKAIPFQLEQSERSPFFGSGTITLSFQSAATGSVSITQFCPCCHRSFTTCFY